MLKIIFTTLLLIFSQNTVFAANNETCNANTTKAGCNATPGCYWAYTNVDNQSESPYEHCVVCPYYTYNDGTIGDTATACTSCGSTSNGVSWVNSFTGKTSQDQCTYKANCTSAQYFGKINSTYTCTACTANNNPLTNLYYYADGDVSYPYTKQISEYASDFSTACSKCGKFSTSNTNGLGCTCNTGYHVSGKTNSDTNNNSTDCDPNKYTITYKSNNGQDKTVEQTVDYNSTITLKGQDTFSKTGHTISGWKYNDITYIPGNQITYDFTSDITLTAQWTEKKFTITYDTGNANCSLSTTQNCTYGGTCNSHRVESCKYSGYIFNGWKCTSGCTDSSSIINMDTNVSSLSNGNDMTLTAQWQQCAAGYYCESVLKQDACPAGSTSDGGKTTQTDCYMTGATKICDTSGNCFTLPDTSQIYYHGGTQ